MALKTRVPRKRRSSDGPEPEADHQHTHRPRLTKPISAFDKAAPVSMTGGVPSPKQNAVRRLIEIFELIVIDRPDEAPDSDAEQPQYQRYQHEEDAHFETRTSPSLSAFPTTSRELGDIQTAAA